MRCRLWGSSGVVKVDTVLTSSLWSSRNLWLAAASTAALFEALGFSALREVFRLLFFRVLVLLADDGGGEAGAGAGTGPLSWCTRLM